MEACFRHQFFLVVADFKRGKFLNYIHTYSMMRARTTFLFWRVEANWPLRPIRMEKSFHARMDVSGLNRSNGNGVRTWQ